MSKIKASIGPIVVAEETIKAGANVGQMKRTLAKNPSDPINFIRIKCNIPQGLNLMDLCDMHQLNFDQEIQKFKLDDNKSLTNMQTRHDELLAALIQNSPAK